MCSSFSFEYLILHLKDFRILPNQTIGHLSVTINTILSVPKTWDQSQSPDDSHMRRHQWIVRGLQLPLAYFIQNHKKSHCFLSLSFSCCNFFLMCAFKRLQRLERGQQIHANLYIFSLESMKYWGTKMAAESLLFVSWIMNFLSFPPFPLNQPSGNSLVFRMLRKKWLSIGSSQVISPTPRSSLPLSC